MNPRSSKTVLSQLKVAMNVLLVFILAFSGSVLSVPKHVLAANDWESKTTTSDYDFKKIAYGNGVYVALQGFKDIYTSTDSINWSKVGQEVTQKDLEGLNFTNGKFFIGSNRDSGTPGATIMYSEDGVNWTAANWLEQGYNDDSEFTSFAGDGANNVTATMGNGGFDIYSTDGGVNWTFGDTRLGDQSSMGLYYRSTSYGDGHFVAVGLTSEDDGIVIRSKNDTGSGEWESLNTLPSIRALNAITNDGKRFVAVGDDGKIVYSTDLSSVPLNEANSGVTTNLKSIAYSGGKFVAVGDMGTVIVSDDGITWEEKEMDFDTSLKSVIWDGKDFIVIGYEIVAKLNEAHVEPEVTAYNSKQLASYLNNPAVIKINLVNGTNYEYRGGTISRNLTLNGNGAIITATGAISDSVIRSDDVTVQSSGLSNYTDVKTFITVQNGSSLALNDVTLQNEDNNEVFAVINVKSGGSLQMNGTTLKGFHNNKLPGNNLSFGIHAEPGADSTSIVNSTFDSSNAFRNAIAIRSGSFLISNNFFEGTSYPERLRQSDGYEYAVYIYGGTGTINYNSIYGYNSTTQKGYASSGISIIGFYPTDVTVTNNMLSYNESGLDVTKTWSSWSSNTFMKVNGLTLNSSEDAFLIGEQLKEINNQEYVSVSLDQNDEVEFTDSSPNYYSVMGGYRSPYLAVIDVTKESAILRFPSSTVLNTAESVELEQQIDEEVNWTKAIWTGTPIEALVKLDPNHAYRFRLKLTHNSFVEASDPVPRKLVTYSNPVSLKILVDAETPTITTHPSDHSVSKNVATTLSVGAKLESSGTLSYQWYSNNVNSFSGSTTISDATSSTYKVPTHTVGTTYYYVKVTNTDSNATDKKTAKAVSRIAKVTVSEATGDSGSSSNSGSSQPSVSNPASTQKEILVDVKAGEGEVISQTSIKRTTEVNGVVKDEVTLTPERATQSINQLKDKKDKTARIVIPDEKDIVSEVKVKLPTLAVENFMRGHTNLGIDTENVSIFVPNQSLSGFNQDLYFLIVPVKKEAERKQIEQRAKEEEQIAQIVKNQDIKIMGRPMTIETNMQSRPVTLTLPLKDLPANETQRQAILDNLVVFIEHSDGTKELLRGDLVKNQDGSLGVKFEINKFSTFTLLYIEGWKEYFAAQQQAGTHQPYIKGFEDGTFRPQKLVTRSEMAAMLARNLNVTAEVPTQATFKDADAKHWAFKEIELVNAAKLMTGYSDGSFGTEQGITRAELAAIVDRWLSNQGKNEASLTSTTATSAVATYSDLNSRHWAYQAIMNVSASGIMDGYGNQTFKPDQKLTRAEAVKVLNRLFNRGPLYGVEASSFTDVSTSYWAFTEIEEAAKIHSYTRNAEDHELYQK
jgi:photosystem II stability/assembly factor-like uncharacterized protein